MAVNTKGKRKITVNSKKYLWWVFNEVDQTEFDGNQIKIVAENQVGYFKYGLEQNLKERCVAISLKNEKLKIHIQCPKFEDANGIIKPSGIERLIKWCLEKPINKNRIFTHGYNPAIGIIPNEDRIKALEAILNEFEQ